MPNYNHILLMGHLTRDPQLSYTPSQTAVVDFGMATNYKWRGKDGNDREEVCFVDCRAFGKRAEVINQYFSKGSPIFVDGRLSFEQWEKENGEKRNKHRVIVNNFQFVGGGGSDDSEKPSRNETRNETRRQESEANDDIPF